MEIVRKGDLGDADHVRDDARREGGGELRGRCTLLWPAPPRPWSAPPTKKNHQDDFEQAQYFSAEERPGRLWSVSRPAGLAYPKSGLEGSGASAVLRAQNRPSSTQQPLCYTGTEGEDEAGAMIERLWFFRRCG
jgi:hypothetical protein